MEHIQWTWWEQVQEVEPMHQTERAQWTEEAQVENLLAPALQGPTLQVRCDCPLGPPQDSHQHP